MKFAVLVLLFVAGTYAAGVERGNRMVDLIVQDSLNKWCDMVRARGLDPHEADRHDLDFTLLEGLVWAKIHIRDLQMFGAADLDIRKMKYNILWGILEYDVRFTRFFIRIGHADVRVKYGDTEIAGTVRGNMEFVAVGVGGTAHMWYDYQGIAHIKTINPELRSESIRSDVKVVGSRDYSDQVNNFFNYEILPLYEKYQHEVNTMLGQVIIWGVDWIRSIR